MAQEQQRNCVVTIDGVPAGQFDKRTGGKVQADVTKYKEAGGRIRLLGGRPDAPDDVQLERRYDKDRDHPNIGTWRARCGAGEVVITETLLDANDNPIGRPDVYSGILKEVESPDYDSGSSDPQMLKLTVAIRSIT